MTRSRPNPETQEFLTVSPRMQAVLHQAQHYARSRAGLLLRGETGVGKDFLARLIHQQSGRPGRFVECKITDWPENLLESELFGCERGAFTGAHARRAGRIEAAQNGTLFLNEVGKIPRHLQSKLFTVLDTSEIMRLGSYVPTSVNVRIIAATSEDLEAAVRQGTLLAELYYRLSVLPIYIPPLRERREDIPRLVETFLRKHGDGAMKTVAQTAMDLLQHYDFPGNVRELEHTLLRAIVKASGDVIEPQDIIFYSIHATGEPARILKALQEHRTVTHAARALSMHRSTLYDKIKKYNLPLEELHPPRHAPTYRAEMKAYNERLARRAYRLREA